MSCIPAIETPANIRAAEIATRELNAGYLTVMLEGKYTDAYLAQAGKDAPKYTAEDLRIISSPIDFVGLNVYMPDHYVVAADNERGFTLAPFPKSFPHMNATWLRPGPEAMYWVPRHVAKLWNVKSIYITENGTSGSDQPAADGTIYDVDRIMYLRNYLTQLQRATSEGVPVHGYFLWSLMDNFEWSDGYEQRFGLYHVDFDTKRRTPKLSAIVLSRDDRAKRRGVIRRLSILCAQALAQRLKHHRLQRQLDPPALRRGLHHEDNEHVVLGIDKIEAAARAVPAVFAERPCRIRRRRGAHGKAKTEAAGRARKIEGVVNDPGLRPDLIRRHQCDCLGLEVPLAVQLASVQQHLQEAGVVPDRRDQARSAGFPAPRQCRILDSGHPKTIDGKCLAMRGHFASSAT